MKNIIIIGLIGLSVFNFFLFKNAQNQSKKLTVIAQEAIDQGNACLEYAYQCRDELDACVEAEPIEWQPNAIWL